MATPPDSDLVIDIRGLVKRFGNTTALDGLDLHVARGEVHGFLGPNGSGKTTALRVLLGLLRADAGEVLLFGADPWRDAAALHRRLAYVPGDVSLWPNLTGGEVIDLLGRMRGGYDSAATRRLIELFELDPTKKARNYSKGNRQKVALIAALAGQSELLLLDEPTSGLDPIMEDIFRTCVREARDQGTSVLLSSHILSEAEALSDRVSIIREGRRVEAGTLAELRHLTGTTVLAVVGTVPPGLAEIEGVSDLRVEGHRITARVSAGAMAPVMSLLADAGVRELSSAPATLEQIFLQQYGHGGAA